MEEAVFGACANGEENGRSGVRMLPIRMQEAENAFIKSAENLRQAIKQQAERTAVVAFDFCKQRVDSEAKISRRTVDVASRVRLVKKRRNFSER